MRVFRRQEGFHQRVEILSKLSQTLTAKNLFKASLCGRVEGVTKGGRTSELTQNRVITSEVKFANFYPFSDIETISPRPMLIIAGETAHSRGFSEDAYKRAGEPKELFVVPGPGHADLYDRGNLIPFDKLSVFFRAQLSNSKVAERAAAK